MLTAHHRPMPPLAFIGRDARACRGLNRHGQPSGGIHSRLQETVALFVIFAMLSPLIIGVMQWGKEEDTPAVTAPDIVTSPEPVVTTGLRSTPIAPIPEPAPPP